MADLVIYFLMFCVIFALRLYCKHNVHIVLKSLILLLIPRPWLVEFVCNFSQAKPREKVTDSSTGLLVNAAHCAEII